MNQKIKEGILKSLLKVSEVEEEGSIKISEKGEIYLYTNKQWILAEYPGDWEEVYTIDGKIIGRVNKDKFIDYRVI